VDFNFKSSTDQKRIGNFAVAIEQQDCSLPTDI